MNIYAHMAKCSHHILEFKKGRLHSVNTVNTLNCTHLKRLKRAKFILYVFTIIKKNFLIGEGREGMGDSKGKKW